MWDFDLADVHKKEFVKIENNFRTCKSFVNDYNMDRQQLANDIISYAKIFIKYLDPAILNDRIPQHAGIKRISCIINATKTYSVIPYVLYILHEVQDESERNRIFEYLEIYLVRRILAGSKNNSYSDLFSENLIHNHINSFDSFKKYIEGRDSDLSMPTLNKIKIGMKAIGVNELQARLIIYLYETKLCRTSDPNSLNGGFNDYYAEQLMPRGNQTYKNWPKYRQDSNKEERRQTLIGTLGNYFMLENGGKKDMKKNVDAACQQKLAVMSNHSQNIRSNQVFGAITAWTMDDISTRNENYANLFDINIWPLV